MGTHGITAGTSHRQRDGKRGEQLVSERKRGTGWGGRKTKRRGHNDRGRIMTIITIYMQVPSLPAHEQSTHSISYLIWIIQTNLSFLPSFLCTLYNPNKRDETSTASRSLFHYRRRWRRRRFVSYPRFYPCASNWTATDSISFPSLCLFIPYRSFFLSR